MTEEEIHAWITFSTVPDMGLEDAVRLLGDFGSPGAVLDSSLSELRHAVTDELARRIASGPEDEQAEVIEKTEDWLMVTLEDQCRMWFRGESAKPLAIVEVKVFGNKIDREGSERMTQEVCALFQKELGVDPKDLYVRYLASPDWGWNNGNF